MDNSSPHIAILPSPGMGHLIPLVELSKRLVENHHFSITLIIATTGSSPPSKAQHSVLESLPKSVNSIILPPVSFDDLPENSMAETQIFLSMTRSIPLIRDAVKGILAKVCLVAMIVDPFGSDVMDLARELDIPPYLFFPSNAMNLAFSIMLPRLDTEVSCEFKDLLEPVQIPGCVPVHGKDLMDPVQDRSNDAYKWILHHAKRFVLAEGILVNSFMELEEGALKHLQEKEPPVYPVGPLIKTGPRNEERDRANDHECLKWLDNQPSDSVLFVSFGSGGTLSHNQVNELALGLESSGHKFLWVVRSPNDESSNAAFFSVQSKDDPFGFLPKGFLNRTKDQGLVVSSWAPQIEVLGHRATGGFLSHCGWNSTLESIVHGVPIVAWPLYAEQKMNAILLSEDLKVALRAKVSSSNGIVEREEIANVVKNLMEEGSEEGEKVRNGMKRMKEAARKVLSHDYGASSTEAITKLASQWIMNHKSSNQHMYNIIH